MAKIFRGFGGAGLSSGVFVAYQDAMLREVRRLTACRARFSHCVPALVKTPTGFSRRRSHLHQQTYTAFNRLQSFRSIATTFTRQQFFQGNPADDNSDSDREGSSARPSFPEYSNSYHVWPNLFYTVRNWVQTYTVVKPFFDKNFHLNKFMEGAKQALVSVSRLISEDKLDELEGLVTADVLAIIRQKHLMLTDDHKEMLQIELSDIYLSFPYQLGILMNNNDAGQRSVEILAVCHMLRGFEKFKKEGGVKDPMDMKSKFLFANVRFYRNYSANAPDGEWTINLLNYFGHRG